MLLEVNVFGRMRRDGLDLFLLKGPEVGETQALLLLPVELFELLTGLTPLLESGGHLLHGSQAVAKLVEHIALGFMREQPLLVMLAMDVAEPGGDLFEESGSDGARVDVGARLAIEKNFTLDQDLFFERIDTGTGQDGGEGRGAGLLEDAGDASPLGSGADHLDRRPAAQQQSQRIDDDRFSATRLARHDVQAGMERNAQTFHYRVVLHHKFKQH